MQYEMQRHTPLALRFSVEGALAGGRAAVAGHLRLALLLLEPVVERQLLARSDVGARTEHQVLGTLDVQQLHSRVYFAFI